MNTAASAAAAESTTTQPAAARSTATPGLSFVRHFTNPAIDPYTQVQWELRDAVIQDWKGNLIFEQKNVESPADWSMTATNIVASKYLHGLVGTPERESGVRALITRVAESIRDWGIHAGYFASEADAHTFYAELVHLLLNQKVAFNSPVWFNVGCDRLEPNSDAQNWHWDAAKRQVVFSTTGYSKPQCSACFINSVQDSLDSILTLAKTEGMLFKWGSGAGSNLSTIRGSMETLSGGGTASGPLSFMRGFDAFAGVIKSGGKTRRAAKMVVLNVDHPDIVDFIECKGKEEAKAYTLIAAGYDGSGPDSEAYSSIFFQNANNSVRVTDEFMSAVERDQEFATRTVKDRKPVADLQGARPDAHDRRKHLGLRGPRHAVRHHDQPLAHEQELGPHQRVQPLLRVHVPRRLGLQPGQLQPAQVRLARRPVRYCRPTGTPSPSSPQQWKLSSTRPAIPTEMIAKNSHDYRPLGLGYANLGALLMSFGLPYDSDAGRDFAATLTAILCGDAYYQSALIAETCPPLAAATTLTQNAGPQQGGACPGFYVNREPFLDVIRMHRAEVNHIGKSRTSSEPFHVPHLDDLVAASKDAWDQALVKGEQYGYRNSQVTVLAPTGTIGFMMDCDTTGIEPDLALVKYKKLVGGGMIKIVNNTVPSALIKLGYSEADMQAIVSYIDATGTIEGAPALKPEHLACFDCSFKPAKGTRSIHYMGHIKMMAATQPFLSGAISKTVNLPNDCSVEDIAEAYLESWRQGIKAVAIYRDGSKGAQPLNVTAEADKNKKAVASTEAVDANPAQVEIDETIAAYTEAAASLATAARIPNGDNLAILSAAKDHILATEAQVHALQTKLAAHLEQSLLNSDAHDSKQPPRAVRHRLPAERASVTHKFGLGGHEGYITVGLYPNGQPGEIFIRMAKEGSTVSGLMDSFATAISLALQHGVPLKVLCEKFAHTRFEPSGWTGNEQIGYAKSLMDYMFRWIELRFLQGTQLDLFAGLKPQATVPVEGSVSAPANTVAMANSGGSAAISAAGDTAAYSAAPTIHLNPAEEYATDVTVTTPPQQVHVTAGPVPSLAEEFEDRTAPRGGIAPDLQARSGLTEPAPNPSTFEDRGIFHTANALRDIVNMGDAPACTTCGAIMTRNGSCYRCMECGSTSGCS